jgi:hypothetical protein
VSTIHNDIVAMLWPDIVGYSTVTHYRHEAKPPLSTEETFSPDNRKPIDEVDEAILSTLIEESRFIENVGSCSWAKRNNAIPASLLRTVRPVLLHNTSANWELSRRAEKLRHQTIQELARIIQEVWSSLDQDMIDRLVDHFPDRLNLVIQAQ